MGEVVQLSDARRTCRPRVHDAVARGEGTVAFFTGIRIERWGERDPGPAPTPETRPTTPRRRRRRT